METYEQKIKAIDNAVNKAVQQRERLNVECREDVRKLLPGTEIGWSKWAQLRDIFEDYFKDLEDI